MYDTAATAIEWILAVAAAILLLIFTGGTAAVLIPALIGAAQVAYAIGKSAWDEYWSSEVWDAIVCALYCHIGEDGTFNGAQFSEFLAQYSADLPAGIPKDMLYRDFQAIGAKGLSTLCSYGIVTSGSDCSACGCVGCDLETWDVYGAGTVVSNDGIEVICDSTLEGDGRYYVRLISPSDEVGCCLVTPTLVSGTAITLVAAKDTGESRTDEVGWDFSYIPSAGRSVNCVLVRATEAFRVKYTAAACE